MLLFQIILGGETPVTVRTETGSSFFPLLVLIFVVVTFLGLALHRLFRKLREPELHGFTRARIASTWAEIIKTQAQGIMGAKIAVIEADKLLDGVLKSMFMPGETLGERLKSAAYKYPNIRQVWGAHRLRNQLVHDASFEISMSQARQAIRDYEAAFKTLNVM